MGTLNNANTEQMENFRYSEGTSLCIWKWSNPTDRAFLVTTYMFNVWPAVCHLPAIIFVANTRINQLQ